jgi:hypothetical protein
MDIIHKWHGRQPSTLDVAKSKRVTKVASTVLSKFAGILLPAIAI